MKIEANSTYLAEILTPVASGVYRSEIIWLNATADCFEAKVIAEGDVTASVSLKCKEHPSLQYVCREQGGGAVNAGVLQEHLKSINNRTILIEFSETPRIAILPECGESNLIMEPFEPIDPSVILKEPDDGFVVEREILLYGLKTVRYAMGTEPSKPHYMGIAVEISKSKIRCVGGSGAFFAAQSMQSKRLVNVEHVIKVFFTDRDYCRYHYLTCGCRG